jgi:hypothetical protein
MLLQLFGGECIPTPLRSFDLQMARFPSPPLLHLLVYYTRIRSLLKIFLPFMTCTHIGSAKFDFGIVVKWGRMLDEIAAEFVPVINAGNEAGKVGDSFCAKDMISSKAGLLVAITLVTAGQSARTSASGLIFTSRTVYARLGFLPHPRR